MVLSWGYSHICTTLGLGGAPRFANNIPEVTQWILLVHRLILATTRAVRRPDEHL